MTTNRLPILVWVMAVPLWANADEYVSSIQIATSPSRSRRRRGFRVVRFEYPYVAAKRFTGKSKPPDREPVLRETYASLQRIKQLPALKKLTLGGVDIPKEDVDRLKQELPQAKVEWTEPTEAQQKRIRALFGGG